MILALLARIIYDYLVDWVGFLWFKLALRFPIEYDFIVEGCSPQH